MTKEHDRCNANTRSFDPVSSSKSLMIKRLYGVFCISGSEHARLAQQGDRQAASSPAIAVTKDCQCLATAFSCGLDYHDVPDITAMRFLMNAWSLADVVISLQCLNRNRRKCFCFDCS